MPRAKKSLGQNFLVDRNVVRKITGLLNAGPGDRVLEIGPGQGALTGQLLETGCQVVAVDKDRELALLLKKRWPQLGLAVMDAMDLAWERLAGGPGWKIIGNLPYNIASPLIWDCVSKVQTAGIMVFTVQLEVARRLASPPGSKTYGALSVWVQSFAHVEISFTLSPHVFRPRPKVNSGVVVFRPRRGAPGATEALALTRLLHHLFAQRRKQLGTILRNLRVPNWENHLKKLGINQQLRPEHLSPDQFRDLAGCLED